MLAHQVVCGLLPKDGNDVQKALDEASAAGYQLLSTTSCAIDEANAYYIATFGKPVESPKSMVRNSISMSGGGSRQRTEPPNVNSSPSAQSKNP